ncbi:MAG: DUF2532 domain-containing protein [Rickettsia endosymbiont of Pentastiridius leporinus]
MNAKLIIYILVLLSVVKVNANTDMQDNFNLTEQKVIKLPWSDCTEIHKLLEKKFSFSEKQVKKENRIYEEYKQFYLKHKSPSNFSMQFLEKKSENDRVEALISGFLKFCEDNFQTSNNKSNSLSYRIKQQQESQFKDMQNKYYKMYYKQKYGENILLPSYNIN